MTIFLAMNDHALQILITSENTYTSMRQRGISDTQFVTNELKKAITEERGEEIARFFDITFLRNHRDSCQRLVDENISSILVNDLWMEAFSFLFQVPLAPNEQLGFELYNQASSPLIRDFKSLVSNLGVPCVKSIARSLRYYATNVDYNESVNQMQKLLRLALTTKCTIHGGSSLMTVVNELMAVYFQMNNFKQAENLLKTVNQTVNDNMYYFSASEICTFKFYRGRINAIYQNYKDAYDDLKYAYNTCPMKLFGNRRLILLYLIPVSFFFGQVPTYNTIQKYNLGIFSEFVNAIAVGTVQRYDAALKKNQLILIKLGLYQLMSSARIIAFYQLLKYVYTQFGSDKFPVRVFYESLLVKEEDNKVPKYTIDDAEAIISFLIDLKLIKAYVHHKLHFVVFGANAFAPLSVYD